MEQTNLPYTSAWTDFGELYSRSIYSRRIYSDLGDSIFVRGTAKKIKGNNLTIAILPEKHCPPVEIKFLVSSENGSILSKVTPDGAITLESDPGAWISFELLFPTN